MATTKGLQIMATTSRTQEIMEASTEELQKLVKRATQELQDREREERAERKAAKKKSGREVVGEKVSTGNGSYHWEETNCGESTCHCAKGIQHGPYLYKRGVKNGTKSRKIYIPIKDVHLHPGAPPRPPLKNA